MEENTHQKIKISLLSFGTIEMPVVSTPVLLFGGSKRVEQ